MEVTNEQGLSREQIEEARSNRISLQGACRTMPSDNARLRIHVLASGSKGNASLIENIATGEGILIDCGICKRDVLSRSAEAGFDLGKLKAVLVTHEQSKRQLSSLKLLA